MTARKGSLLKALAELASKHSPAEWHRAADQIEEIAELARALAAKRSLKGAKNPRRTLPKNGPIPKSSSKRDDLSGISVADLRELAVEIGIKDDLQKSKDSIILQIESFLDNSDSNLRRQKLLKLRQKLASQKSDQGNDYERWVNLITKKTLD